MKKQWTAFFLLAALSLGACGSQENTIPADTALSSSLSQTETETETDAYSTPQPELPDKDFGGADFTFLANPRTAASFKEIYLYTEATDGEIVNDTVFNRNAQIESKFNVTIKVNEQENTHEVAKKLIQAGDTSVDVIDAQAVYLVGLATEGYLYDFHDIPYITPDAPYFSEAVSEDLNFSGHLYIMPCDMSMRFFGASRFIYYNKKLVNTYNLENPYDLVTDGTWTLDKMLDMISAVHADLDGDGAYTEADLFGYMAESGETAVDMVIGSGFQFISHDSDGNLQVTDDLSRAQSVLEKTSAVFADNEMVINFDQLKAPQDQTVWNYGRTLFNAGQILFTTAGISDMVQFRNMADDFGILPNPKYDEAQASYYQRASVWDLMFAVPQNVADTEKVGLIMEYGAWLSHETLLPAFYETTIKQKIVRDDKDTEMLEIIRTTTHVDIADLFQIGFNEVIFSSYKNATFISTYEKRQKGIKNKLQKILDGIAALNE